VEHKTLAQSISTNKLLILTHIYNSNNNHFNIMALCPGLPGWAGTRRNIHPHPDHHPIFISFFHLLRSVSFSLFRLRAWQSFCTTSLHVIIGLPLGLEPSTSYSIHFFTKSLSSFRNTCPYYCNLFCCSIKIISSVHSLSPNSLLGTLSFTLTLHIHLTILICARWSGTSFFSWQARSRFHVSYYFARNCYITSLS